MRWGAAIARAAFVALVCAFLIAPIVVVLVASLTTKEYLTFPPVGLSLHWYRYAFDNGTFMASLVFSLWVSAVVASLATVLGFFVALGINRAFTAQSSKSTGWSRLVLMLDNQTSAAIRLLGIAPLMLPVLVLAVALLAMAAETHLQASPLSIIFGQLVIALPFGVLMSEIGLMNVNPVACMAAESLGASRWRVLARIVAPLAAAGVAGAWAFGFVVAFGDATIALLLQSQGNVTAPVDIFNQLYFDPFSPGVAAMAGFLALITLVCLGVVLAVTGRSQK